VRSLGAGCRCQLACSNLENSIACTGGESSAVQTPVGLTERGRVGPRGADLPTSPLVSSAVTHCVDLVAGLVTAGDVGEFGAAWDRVVLGGEVQVERSFAGPHFVTVTAVTAKGIGYLLLWLSRSRDYESPADIRHGTAGTGPTILVTSRAARSDGFTPLRGLRRAGIQGCRWAATRWKCPQRADLRGRRDDPLRHPQHVVRIRHLHLQHPAALTHPAWSSTATSALPRPHPDPGSRARPEFRRLGRNTL
jgi:hypothetical protein